MCKAIMGKQKQTWPKQAEDENKLDMILLVAKV